MTERQPLRRMVRLVTDRGDGHHFKIGLENVEGWTGRYIESATAFDGAGTAFRPGDVLFGKLRPYLAKAWVADRYGAAVGDFLVLRPSRGLDSRYLRDFLTMRETIDLLSAAVYGAKMPRANWETVGTLMVPNLSLFQQRNIAGWLSAEAAVVQGFVSDQERFIDLLNERRGSLIASKIGRFASNEVVLGRFASQLTSGSRGWAEHYSPVGDVFLRMANLSRGSFDLRLDEIQRVNVDPHAEGARTRTRTGDLLLSITAYLGSVGLVTPAVAGAYVSQHVALLRLREQEFNHRFAAYVLLGPAVQAQLKSAANGVAKTQLALDDIKRLKVVRPPLEEQCRVVQELDSAMLSIKEATDEARAAIALSEERHAALATAAITGGFDIADRRKVLA